MSILALEGIIFALEDARILEQQKLRVALRPMKNLKKG